MNPERGLKILARISLDAALVLMLLIVLILPISSVTLINVAKSGGNVLSGATKDPNYTEETQDNKTYRNIRSITEINETSESSDPYAMPGSR